MTPRLSYSAVMYLDMNWVFSVHFQDNGKYIQKRTMRFESAWLGMQLLLS